MAEIEKAGSRLRTPVLIVFVVALAIRLLHLWELRSSPYFTHLLGDAIGYDTWARDIAAGNWRGSTVFYQAPLYPYLLGGLYALTGPGVVVVRLVQALLGSLSCVLLCLAARHWFGRGAGLAAGLILALYGPALFFDSLLQKSVWDVLFLTALLFLISRTGSSPAPLRMLGIGMLLGALALTRENALVLVPVICIWLWMISPARVSAVALVLAGALVMIGPVSIRNRLVGGEWQLTTAQSGANLYIGNNPSATGTYVPLRAGYGSVEFEESDARTLAEAGAGRKLTAAGVAHYWRSRALDWVESHPADWLALTAKKAGLLVNRREAADSEDLDTYAEWSWPLRVIDMVSNFGTLAPLAVLGMWVTRRRWRDLWVLYALPLAYAASVLLFFVLDRYRYPLVPFVALFAGAAIASAPGWWTRSHVRERMIAAALVLVSAVACNWPLALLDAHRQRAVTRYNLAAALQADGSTDEAIALYTEARDLLPSMVEPHLNLGVLLADKGQIDAARAESAEAVRLDPNRPEGHTNLGSALAMLGRYEEAIVELERAVALEPNNAQSHYNLATASAGAGRLDAARREFEEALRLDPDKADAHNNLGSLLASEGRLAEAVEHFRAAVRLRPDLEEARANLARAEQELRKR